MPQERDEDGRSAVKRRHRQAIVDATAGLLDRRGARGVAVEDIAAAAGVSRRTVFNHFASLDQLHMAVCEHQCEHVVASLVATLAASVRDDDSPAQTLRAVARAVEDADLPLLIRTVLEVCGDDEGRSREAKQMSQAVLERVGDQMIDELLPHRGEQPVLALRLLISALMHGMVVIAEQWVEETGADLGAESRQRWHALVAVLLHQVGHGYAAERRRPT